MRCIVLLLAMLPAGVDAAPSRRTSASHVAAAANRCGLRGVTIRRDGPRRFLLEQLAGETTVTIEQEPLSPEREHQLQAQADAALRSWNCLLHWGRQRRLSIQWAPPEMIVY